MENKLKKVWLLPILLMTLLSCLTCSSCSDDDKDNPTVPETQASIIGTWRTEFTGGYLLLSFEKNGTFSLMEYEEEFGISKDFGTYTLNKDQLTLVYSDGEDNEATIITLTSEKLILLFVEGEYEVFTRVK